MLKEINVFVMTTEQSDLNFCNSCLIDVQSSDMPDISTVSSECPEACDISCSVHGHHHSAITQVQFCKGSHTSS